MSVEKNPIQKITIHNKLEDAYKTFHVDGAFGGLTPKGLISLSFYSERFPIPKSHDFAVSDGKLGNLISNSPDSKIGIIRGYEAGIMMDINVAMDIVKLLSEQIEEYENYLKNKL